MLTGSRNGGIEGGYKNLVASLEEGKLILASEYRKLKDFNANPL
ncbi:hypothetical protein [Paraflavitalea speifideaquila]|nr:hypothetical protein [Paraflavitalea speifideiaquila]